MTNVTHTTDGIHDLAVSVIHLDASVLATRQAAEHLNESWSTLRRFLATELLDAIWADPGFRLDERMRVAMDAEFAANALIEQAMFRGWVRGERGVIHETAEYPDLLLRITVACGDTL